MDADTVAYYGMVEHYSVEWHGMRDDKVMLYLNGDRARNETLLYDSVLITVYWIENPSDTKKSLELEIYRTEGKLSCVTTCSVVTVHSFEKINSVQSQLLKGIATR